MSEQIQCCGSLRSTPFCSQCGNKLLGAPPLVGLLTHVSTHARLLEGKVELERKVGTEQSIRALAKLEKSFAKWQAWESALDEIVNGESDE